MKILLTTKLIFLIGFTSLAQLSATQFTGANNSQVFIGDYDVLNGFNLSGTSELTVSLWVKWDNKSAGGPWANMFTLNRTTGSGDNGIFWFQHNNGNTRFEFAAEANSRRFVQSTTNPIDGQWYHLAGVYDGNEIRIYVDGVLENTNTSISGNLTYYSDMALYFGRWARDNNRNFSGCIAEASLWSRVLTNTEIQDMMYNHLSVTGGAYNATGLIGYWDLNDFTNAIDNVGNNDGLGNLVIDCSENPLPIELSKFNAIPTPENQALLTWTTVSERNNDYFTLERSADGYIFEEIATLDGAGNSVQEIDYEYTDKSPLIGVSYYRLKQTDFDGTYSYSDIRSVQFHNEEEFSVFPNPIQTGQYLTIKTNKQDGTSKTYKIFSYSGQLVYQDKLINDKINISLKPGSYLLWIEDRNKPIKLVVK